MSENKTLAARLVEAIKVCRDLGPLPKAGETKFKTKQGKEAKYPHVRAEDVAERVQRVLAAVGIGQIVDTELVEAAGMPAVQIVVTMFCVETVLDGRDIENFRPLPGPMMAERIVPLDSSGTKAFHAAETVALKYHWIRQLSIPVVDDLDEWVADHPHGGAGHRQPEPAKGDEEARVSDPQPAPPTTPTDSHVVVTTTVGGTPTSGTSHHILDPPDAGQPEPNERTVRGQSANAPEDAAAVSTTTQPASPTPPPTGSASPLRARVTQYVLRAKKRLEAEYEYKPGDVQRAFEDWFGEEHIARLFYVDSEGRRRLNVQEVTADDLLRFSQAATLFFRDTKPHTATA